MVRLHQNRYGGYLMIFIQFSIKTYGYSLESPCHGSSNKYPQQTVLWRKTDQGSKHENSDTAVIILKFEQCDFNIH